MKPKSFRQPRPRPGRPTTASHATIPRTAALLACLQCGGLALGQTNAPAPATASPAPNASTNVVQLETTTVIGQLDVARQKIVPELGGTVYGISQEQIKALPQGENASLNQVLLRAPGMAQDSAVNDGLHLRGEHANIQYRINDVLLPEGITGGFGQELSPRFVDKLQLITGSLPAQYGFRTAGVVDITTKSGIFEPGGVASLYGGSHGTVNPSLEYSGSSHGWNFYTDGSYLHNTLGIENPTPSNQAVHDVTDQYRAFAYASKVLDDTSRISLMGSLSYIDFQIPNTPGLPPGTSPNGNPWLPGTFNSATLNENQTEQNYYGVAAYQKSAGELNLQVAAFGRASGVHFTPDPVGDLYFNGVASEVDRMLYSGGLETDASYGLGEHHTVRGGFMLLDEEVQATTSTSVFRVNAAGNPISPAYTIPDNNNTRALFFGLYLQDEWKLLPKLTLNYGARFDLYDASFDSENQVSPRINLIYQPAEGTALHAGYSRYFTPPPIENVNPTSVDKFNGTSNGPQTDQDSTVKAERADYFDVGVAQKILPGLQVGVDGYYKQAKNQLDDGLFGQTYIESAFNYAKGRIWGIESTASYTTGGFNVYANVAYSVAQGEDWNSAQFQFDTADLAYSKNHWIYLDHDQRVTGSFGASHLWKHHAGSTRVYVDALYGSGLRTDSTAPDGSNVPNGGSVPAYYTVGVGVEEGFKIEGRERLKVRLDIVNLTDNVYQLRNGTGVGVNASQYGARLGVFAGVSYLF